MTLHGTAHASLRFDDLSLSPGQPSVPALMRELTVQEGPAWLLAKLMNVQEQRRQAQGWGGRAHGTSTA